jgi:hypothetical protein
MTTATMALAAAIAAAYMGEGFKVGSSCESICYARNLERVFTAAGTLVTGNLLMLQACKDDVGAMTNLLESMVGEFVSDVARLVKKGRGAWSDLAMFRIHWDGDFYSEAYAQAWRNVILANPTVRFWTYTRSFTAAVNVVPILAGIENLTLYLSVDDANRNVAADVLASFPMVKVASLTMTFAEGSEAFVSIGRKDAPKCPELTGRVPLVGPMTRDARFEIGDDGRGACIACGLCVKGTADVRFAIDHKSK